MRSSDSSAVPRLLPCRRYSLGTRNSRLGRRSRMSSSSSSSYWRIVFLVNSVFSGQMVQRNRVIQDCYLCQNAVATSVDVLVAGLEMERLSRREETAGRFGCCFGCFELQELCTVWEEDEVRGWRRTAGKRRGYTMIGRSCRGCLSQVR